LECAYIYQKRKEGVNIFLGLFVLAFVMGSVKIVLQEKIPYFNRDLPFPLLYQFTFGPLLYLCLKSVLTVSYRFTVRQLWHFLPSLLFDVLPALFLFPISYTIARSEAHGIACSTLAEYPLNKSTSQYFNLHAQKDLWN
jgi:hypothetical protein